MMILKEIISKVVGIFSTFFTDGFTSAAHRRRAYIMLFSIAALICTSIYLYDRLNTLQSTRCSNVGDYAKRNVDTVFLKNNLYKSIVKEISSCGEGVYTGKLNFSSLDEGGYVFAFDWLLNNNGKDVRFHTPTAALTYSKQYLVIPKVHDGDLRIIQNSVHGKIYEATPERLDALDSIVFQGFFKGSILKLNRIYYVPFFITANQERSLLYVMTISVAENIKPKCNPNETLTNIFNHLTVFNAEQLKLYNIAI